MHTDDIFESVRNCIAHIDQNKQSFVHSPETDFTRNRKISFSDCLTGCLFMAGGSIFSELLEIYESRIDIPTPSAFIQQRSKIKPEAFMELFARSYSLMPERYDSHGYRLFAVDGTDFQIPLNPDDPSTFCPSGDAQKPVSLMHLNALYDILSSSYVDAVLQGRNNWNETDACIEMIERSQLDKVILTADRGYESYNLMAHVREKGWEFLIRVRDAGGKGIVSRLDLPDEDTFDVDIDLNITRKCSNEVKRLVRDYPNKYRYSPSCSRMDFLEPSGYHDPPSFYRLPFRVVRIRLSDEAYEVILTSLPRDEYPAGEIKRLYSLRWGIETSFRTLKYNVGLIYPHSKKKNLQIQEVYACLAMYNIVAAVVSGIRIPDSKSGREYIVNMSNAVRICRKLLLERILFKTAEILLCRSAVPIRKGRRFQRRPAQRKAPNLIYRLP